MTTIQPTLGVCYYPEHWPQEMWTDDARRMVETGITHVRIAEFAWSRMEPARDQFDFEWLDEAIETLGQAGLKITMCTPTATPPKWLVDEMPDMVALDGEGHPRGFGSRRHYCFSHLGYRRECARITEILAKRYGGNPHVVAWQTDNEYGCHDTTISYSNAARDGFRNWLAQKYQSPDALNRAWGNIFWSMEVSDFSQIELPNLTVTEANPAHRLDFRRYTSDQVVAFNKNQTDILRKYTKGRDIVHNFMGRYLDFDHHDVSQDLDVASWDSYPLGFLEQFGKDNPWKAHYLRAGDPDFQAFHHDLYRGCKSRWWVMEQQPGPVNWAPWNPAPYEGMVRLWSHEAFAHGAEIVSYFRWRQPPFAQEQFHTALNRPDNSPDIALSEAAQVAHELAGLPQATTEQAKVALIFDYPSIWATEIQPQGADYDGFNRIFEVYRLLRILGLSIDVIPPSASLEGYKVIIAPHLIFISEDFVTRAKASGASLLFGPRSGSRTLDHQIPPNLPPGNLQNLLNVKVLRAESLRPRSMITLDHHRDKMQLWFEHLETGDTVEIIRTTNDDRPAITRTGKATYLAGWPFSETLKRTIQAILKYEGIETVSTGSDLRIRDRGNLRTIVNYGPKPRDASGLISEGDEILVGSREIGIAGVTIVRRNTV
ncbi:beta-galactosidase [Pseudahrensia aquimaris]|uniref:Beta-galactosidase n=1 Tax=Pseudahrensia aquimaris TaxID=744461 RepID=A0ABW3FE08_9HYPH